MLNNDMLENQLNVVKINGFPSNIVEKFLIYLYLDNTLDLEKNACGLFKIADYYDVEELKVSF